MNPSFKGTFDMAGEDKEIVFSKIDELNTSLRQKGMIPGRLPLSDIASLLGSHSNLDISGTHKQVDDSMNSQNVTMNDFKQASFGASYFALPSQVHQMPSIAGQIISTPQAPLEVYENQPIIQQAIPAQLAVFDLKDSERTAGQQNSYRQLPPSYSRILTQAKSLQNNQASSPNINTVK